MHITILLTLSIPPGEAELPVCVRYDAYLHPEPPGSDLSTKCLPLGVRALEVQVKISRFALVPFAASKLSALKLGMRWWAISSLRPASWPLQDFRQLLVPHP